MNKLAKRGMRLALMTLGFAGLIVAVSAAPAAATGASHFVTTPLARGTDMSDGTLPIKEGLQIVVVTSTVEPGGSSGWHSHPGGAIVVVKAGQITFYRWVGNHCDSTKYIAGQAFIERPGDVGNALNTGSTTTIVYATFPGVPVGGSTKIDVSPAPGTCPGL